MSDDSDHIDNSTRAERFNATLAAYNDEFDHAANLLDLLADARHW